MRFLFVAVFLMLIFGVFSAFGETYGRKAGNNFISILPKVSILESIKSASDDRKLGNCSSNSTFKTVSDWLKSIEKSKDIDSAIRKEIKMRGGTPLCWKDEVIFLAIGEKNKSPQIVGDFNDGGFAVSELFGNGKMQQIGVSQWFALVVKPPKDARFEYLIKRGNKIETDSFNPVKVTTFGTIRSVFTGESFRKIPQSSQNIRKGSLKSFNLASKIRNNERTIKVYLPPNYDPKGVKLPTLYVKDGTRFLEEAELPLILDTLIAQKRLSPIIVIFVDPINRGLEYGTYGNYRRFAIEELIPEIERRFSSGGSPQKRALFGASRGGLAVVDLMRNHPDTFGFVAAMSPALKPLPVVDEITTSSKISGVFLVLTSNYDTPDLIHEGKELSSVLKNRADKLISVEMPIDHSVYGWKKWMDFVLLTWNQEMILKNKRKP